MMDDLLIKLQILIADINHAHMMELATCRRLLEERDAEVARLTALAIDLINMTYRVAEVQHDQKA